MGKKASRYVWGRKEEEYVADFFLVSRRNLEGLEWDIFRFHFLLGGDWRLCCLRLKMDRGTFFHHVYRIEQKLGRLFRNLEPYPLYPLDEYFGGTIRRGPSMAENRRHTYDELPPMMQQDEQNWRTRRAVPIRAPLARVEQQEPPEEKAA